MIENEEEKRFVEKCMIKWDKRKIIVDRYKRKGLRNAKKMWI